MIITSLLWLTYSGHSDPGSPLACSRISVRFWIAIIIIMSQVAVYYHAGLVHVCVHACIILTQWHHKYPIPLSEPLIIRTSHRPLWTSSSFVVASNQQLLHVLVAFQCRGVFLVSVTLLLLLKLQESHNNYYTSITISLHILSLSQWFWLSQHMSYRYQLWLEGFR